MKYLLIVVALFFSACSHFSFNAQMCDQQDMNGNMSMSGECQNYDEEAAEHSAYPKVETQSKEDFNKEIKKGRSSEK